ncbi:MAG TPA: hypothetical protein VLJ79_15605 [Candidatus Binatia bacterium]|nr:hypothetical protein [Candidatus Binatia bacterium]
MHFVVTDFEQAGVVVEYFNGFHDGFIRRLNLLSHDTFEDRDTHVTTGRLDLEILFAHSNYRDGVPPFDQVVAARFNQVRDLRMNVTGLSADWPITNFYFETAAPPTSSDGSRLRARLIQPRLIDNSRWEHVEALTFSFHSAEFSEVAAV